MPNKLIENKKQLYYMFAGIALTALIIWQRKRIMYYFWYPVMLISGEQAFRNFLGGKAFLTNYPKGVRNNNPGNIEMTSGLWSGEIPHSKNTDGRFKQFYRYIYGIRALILNLHSYYKKGYRTIRQIITRWAPPPENDTEAYIQSVSQHMGIADNVPLEYDKKTIKKLVEAIIIKENGKLYMDQGEFTIAWKQI